MKINSKAFYKLVKNDIGNSISASGYKRTKGGMLGWHKSIEDKVFLFWFQCDKWGWEDAWGSSFTIEFQLSDSEEIAGGTIFERNRFPFYLSDSDLEAMRIRNNSIICEMSGYKEGLQEVIESDGERIVLLGKEPTESQYNRSFDPWFNYYTEEDVHFWSRFFIDRLPKIEACVAKA